MINKVKIDIVTRFFRLTKYRVLTSASLCMYNGVYIRKVMVVTCNQKYANTRIVHYRHGEVIYT